MRSKMTMTAVILALVALMFGGVFTSSASAAGPLSNGVNLGGNFRSGNDIPYYQSSFANYEGGTSASFLMFLDPAKASLNYAHWSFSSDSDPDHWMATCTLRGALDVPASPNGQGWSQGADMGDYYVSTSIGTGIWPKYPDDNGEQLCVNGSINLRAEPLKGDVVIDNANFNYWSSSQQQWGYSDDGEWVVTGDVPIWNATFQVNGHFIPEVGGASVPEPATMSLLAMGGFVALLRRRRHRS